MQKSAQLVEQHDALKLEINELIENTLTARILNIVGSFLERAIPQLKPTPWYISALFLEILVVVPQVILALVLRDPDQVIGTGLVWTISSLLVIAGIPEMYLVTKYILTGIRDHIVDGLEEADNVANLRFFLLKIGNGRRAIFFSLVMSFLWSLIAIPIFSTSNHQLIRLSYALGVWIQGFFVLGIGFYFLLWFMQLPQRLKQYHYNLYELDPSQSEIIIHISTLLTHPLVVIAVYLAICTAIINLFAVFNWVLLILIFIFWIPLILHFINSQAAITKIITTAKWQMLNHLQDQIREYKVGTTPNPPEEIESINKLMDLHERVYNSRNNNLTINRVFDLLNQLLLPVLAFIVSNYDSVLKLLKLKP